MSCDDPSDRPAVPNTSVFPAASPRRKADGMTEQAGARRLVAVPEDGGAEGLLRAVGRGDEAAFGRLYDLVAPRVHGLVRRVVRDPAQAEEVTQEVLVEVWRTAARFD